MSWGARAVRRYAFGALKVNKLAVFPQPKAHNWTNCGHGAAKFVHFQKPISFQGIVRCPAARIKLDCRPVLVPPLEGEISRFSYEQISCAHCLPGLELVSTLRTTAAPLFKGQVRESRLIRYAFSGFNSSFERFSEHLRYPVPYREAGHDATANVAIK